MKESPNNYFDLLIVDPPNPYEREYKSQQDYEKWTKNWIKEMPRILKENGSIYVFTSLFNRKLVSKFMKEYFELKAMIYCKYALQYPEYQIIFKYGFPKNNKKNTVRVDNWHISMHMEEKEQISSVIFAEEEEVCRTQLPSGIIDKIIEKEVETLNEDGLANFKLYDLFSGSGVVLEQAKEKGINFVGTEYDKKIYKNIEL